ncbi:MAG TPA: oligopeptide/dipeptide ABC transporter ATP-binding protein [Polyangia bacterium]|jgi:oligopeptide transport system ATP-binding protein|nr:oligopeptide/dipeptide ABC transporter ATP-binding protein [Polyangia bacterium]
MASAEATAAAPAPTPTPTKPGDVLLSVRELRVHFPVGGGVGRAPAVVKAVDGVSFDVRRGETLGLVGESGCGKSTTGRAVLQLLRPTSGQIIFDGRELSGLWRKRFGTWRWSRPLHDLRRRMQMIFQDPYASLNPRMTIEQIVSEPLVNFAVASGDGLRRRVQQLLERVGMDPRYVRRYPHEFSGGQRQRIGIARALALSPEIVICDEPISALDVSIQAQILNLLKDLQRDLGLTYVFIAHDLAAVRHISDRIAVMYLGRIVEVADTETLVRAPAHPYSQALISAVPVPDPEAERRRQPIVLTGDVPSPLSPPSGCRFHTRCPQVFERCPREDPATYEAAPGQFAACHLLDRSAP